MKKAKEDNIDTQRTRNTNPLSNFIKDVQPSFLSNDSVSTKVNTKVDTKRINASYLSNGNSKSDLIKMGGPTRENQFETNTSSSPAQPNKYKRVASQNPRLAKNIYPEIKTVEININVQSQQNSQIEMSYLDQNKNVSNTDQTVDYSEERSQIFQMGNPFVLAEEMKKSNEVHSNLVNAELKDFVVKNSKKLMNVVGSGHSKNGQRVSNPRLMNFKNYKAKKSCISNYLSIDLTTENANENLEVKQQNDSAEVNQYRYKSNPKLSLLNESSLIDINESRIDDEKLNDLRLCNDAHKMLIEYEQLIMQEPDTSVIDKKESESNTLNFIQEETNDQDALNDSLETVVINPKPIIMDEIRTTSRKVSENKDKPHGEVAKLNPINYKRVKKNVIVEDKRESYPRSDSLSVLNQSRGKKKKSGLSKDEVEEVVELSFNEQRQSELKSQLIAELGKLLFESIYEIIELNTPEEYFLYEEELLKKLIVHKLSEDFKEDKILVGLTRILDIYKLIFAKREDSKKITIS